MTRRIISTMRSFAAGQINRGARRRDETDEFRTGAAVMSDWRIEETETLVPRPGRRLLANTGCARIEYVRLASTDYAIGFTIGSNGLGQIEIFSLATAVTVAAYNSPGFIWTAATLGLIYFCVADNQIVVCYPGMQPQVIYYAPSGATFTFLPFAFRDVTFQFQQPFYRTGNLGAHMSYSAVGGEITLTCDQAYFTPAMNGTVLSILGQQVIINAVPTSAFSTQAYVRNRLPDVVSVTVANATGFAAGQIVEDTSASFKMEVSSVNGNTVTGVLTSALIYPGNLTTGDKLVSPLAASVIQGTPTVAGAGTTLQWQEQFMGAVAGWPQACAYDKGRLLFFDFPQKPGAILWSAISAYDTFWIDAGAATLQPDAGTNPQDAILEFIPQGPRVRHVVGSGDEFVFTDRGVFYVPISGSAPLKPGSVEFRRFSSDGVSGIVPIETNNSIIYINAGGKRATVILRTQGYNMPYQTMDPTDFHTDLFTGPVAMAVAQGDGLVPERLIYVLNADGSIVHGKFSRDGKLVGWLPWYSAQPPSWLFSSGPAVFYCVPLAGSSWLAADDITLYLDSVATPNALPVTFPATPTGAGPLYFVMGATVTCMLGLVDLGERQVDVNGNLVLLQDDDPASFASSALQVGFTFTPKLQPFVPAPQPGPSEDQRQHKRSITRALVTIEGSSGFTLGAREVSPYHQGDDESAAPKLYDETAQVRPLGRSYDPGCLLQKPRPGPMRVVEYVTEATA